jgi:hypothetical protein
MSDRSLADSLLCELERDLGPCRLLGLMKDVLSDDSNNFRISAEYEISLFTVNLLRLRRHHCLSFILERAERRRQIVQEKPSPSFSARA